MTSTKVDLAQHAPLMTRVIKRWSKGLWLVVSHGATCMACMEHPAERLGKVISRVDLARYVCHDDVALLFPILDCKPLNFDVARAFGGDFSIDHFDGRFVVAVENRGCQLWVAKVV